MISSDRRVPEFLPLGPANRVHKGLFRDSVDGMQAFFDLQQGSILLFPAAEEGNDGMLEGCATIVCQPCLLFCVLFCLLRVV